MAKKNQVKDRKPLIRDAMLYYYLEFESDVISGDEIKKLLHYADLDKVPDRVILLNDIYQENMDWNQLSNNKIARLISMFIDRGDVDFILNQVQLKERNFKIREIYWSLYRKPELSDAFGLDLDKLSKQDAYKLLEMGHQYFADRINISKYRFNTTEIYNIVKSFQFNRSVMEQLKTELLEGYHISEVLIATGEDNIDLINLGKMNSSHWVKTLEKRKTLFNLCDLNIFLKDDVYHSIGVLSIYPDIQILHDYVKLNYKSIGDKGWEILLTQFPEYVKLCDVNILYAGTWNKILKNQPELVNLRVFAKTKVEEPQED